MLSQKSGISLKDNFEIEIYNGNNVVLYLHNVQYCGDLIKTAVSIIDHFKENSSTTNENSLYIDIETLNIINTEYKNAALERMEHIQTIKVMSDKLIKQTEEFKLPSLELLLNKYYSNSINNEFTCACGKSWTNKRSLGAHQKACKYFKNTL